MEKLEEKLKKVIASVSKRLEESEIENNEYSGFLSKKLEENGVFDREDNKIDEKKLGYIHAILDRKLKITSITGLRQDYSIMPNTQLSEPAQQDIRKFEEFESGLRDYLATIQGKELYEDELESLIKDYVNSNINTAYVDPMRRACINGVCNAIFIRELKIKKKSLAKEYGLEEIEEAFSRV